MTGSAGSKIGPLCATANRYLSPLALVLALCSQGWAGVSLAAVPQPAGYRMELYDDEVPAGLDGARVITALELKKLQQSAFGVVVVDVIPEQRRPGILPQNQLWIPLKHKGVPGAIWLPDVGYGVLSAITETYFKTHLADATAADKSRPVVFYCRTDCWMSWNAAKRALSYGYNNVYWFAEGIDGWYFEDYDIEILKPAAGRRQ